MFRAVVVFGVLVTVLTGHVFTKDISRTNNKEIHKYVTTETGVVRGKLSEDKDYIAFLGIPYAAPPTGKNRFKAPIPIKPWHGVYEANRTVTCPQNGEGEEDCLILNVFTPLGKTDSAVPVLVYIHGGSFRIGVGQTEGVEPLIKQNIIVVTINYRLGALGFLCLGIEEAPGNAGLKDQVAALKWVHKNIKNFGGDPNHVTIYGMSAGGASVEFQVLSQAAAGLFKRAIVESGSATSVWATDAVPIRTAFNLADVLNFPRETSNLYKLVEHYQRVPAKVLSKSNAEYYFNLTDGTFGFVPCVEKTVYGSEPFITESPHNLLKNGEYTKVPMMFLFATLEGLNLRSQEYYAQNYKERMESNFLDFMPADLIFDNENVREETAKNVKHFYFGNKTIGDDTLIEYLNYFGDYLVVHSLLNSVEAHSRDGNPVYLLEFSYKGNMGNYDQFYETIRIAGHGDVIKHAILRNPIENKHDKIAVDRVAELVANFVKFENPTPALTDLLPILWPTVQPDNVKALHLNNQFQINTEPYWDRKAFWDQLYNNFRKNVTAVDTELL